MMDPATAAAMSDPDRNRWFRRRWFEPSSAPPLRPEGPARPGDVVELTGYALLEHWRWEREFAQPAPIKSPHSVVRSDYTSLDIPRRETVND
jgi:hypothetical protein